MPVDSKHPHYEEHAEKWQRCRDCYEGGDSVKARSTAYLPMLDSHKEGQSKGESYRPYLQRALFYNATARTVDGFAGMVFQKEPQIVAPPRIEQHLEDVDLAGTPIDSLAQDAAIEVLQVGRYGVLVEMPDEESPANRPYWITYRAEDIINWRTERFGGDERTVMVVLKESHEADTDDPFERKVKPQYRVLTLEDGAYVQRTWRKIKGEGGKESWQVVSEVMPMRRGLPLPFIPFQFIGPTNTFADVARPPLLDLVDVNLAHYRNSADHEHGLHWTGIPWPWVAGIAGSDEDEVKIGPSEVLILEKEGRAGIIQADGRLLGALESAMESKEKKMATLGARLLEESPSQPETMGAVQLRHVGEHATLRSIATAVERGLTACLQFHAWWTGAEAMPSELDAEVSLNRDFVSVKASAQEVQAAMNLYLSGAWSFEDLYDFLQRGEWGRPGVTAQEALAQINREGGGAPVGEGGPEPDEQ